MPGWLTNGNSHTEPQIQASIAASSVYTYLHQTQKDCVSTELQMAACSQVCRSPCGYRMSGNLSTGEAFLPYCYNDSRMHWLSLHYTSHPGTPHTQGHGLSPQMGMSSLCGFHIHVSYSWFPGSVHCYRGGCCHPVVQE